MTDTQRLSKRLIQLVECSRREAELYIEGGWVLVDGVVVEEPQFQVSPQQIVALHADADVTSAGPISIIFNVIADNDMDISPLTHWPQDPLNKRQLKRHFLHLKPCIPLVPGAAGLQLLTQDWGLQRKWEEVATQIEQEYVLDVKGTLSEEALKLLQRGLSFRGKPLPPCKVSWQTETRLRFALKNPQAGQFQYVCERVGLEILAVKRIRIGALSLSKLAPAQWRYLAPHERV